MNITVKLTTSEAASLLSPVIADKLDNGNFGGRPEVAIEIAVPFVSVVPLSHALPDIARLVRSNKQGNYEKISLIKQIRAVTGWGLKDSKDFVEAFLD
jgi:hypothetical protein